MRALERDVCNREHGRLTLDRFPNDLFPAYESAARRFFLSAEPVDLRLDPLRDHHAGSIVGVEDRAVFRRLVLENARLSGDIVLERAVPIEMMGRDIQDHRNLRVEFLYGLQSDAGFLQ